MIDLFLLPTLLAVHRVFFVLGDFCPAMCLCNFFFVNQSYIVMPCTCPPRSTGAPHAHNCHKCKKAAQACPFDVSAVPLKCSSKILTTDGCNAHCGTLKEASAVPCEADLVFCTPSISQGAVLERNEVLCDRELLLCGPSGFERGPINTAAVVPCSAELLFCSGTTGLQSAPLHAAPALPCDAELLFCSGASGLRTASLVDTGAPLSDGASMAFCQGLCVCRDFSAVIVGHNGNRRV